MSGRRREGLAPNLFPFLAVLICTLGTLILLLALVAQNAGQAFASAATPTKTPEQDAKQRELAETDAVLERRLSEARWHRDQVVQMRDEQTREIDERRIRQAHLEDHIQRLREELARLEAEVVAAQDSSPAGEQTQAAIDAMQREIADQKAKIEELKTEQQTAAPRIVIVPHKGPNGTDRRPVYIECRAKGVYLQPGNVAIDTKYLDNDLSGPNPLDAALKTIRTHALKHYGDTDAPYPLIVVRPDGIETYGAARYAMKGWDDQYGYELVPEDIVLAYPEPDPVLNEQVEQAIAQAVREQQQIARTHYGRGGPGSVAMSRDQSGGGDWQAPSEQGTAAAGQGVTAAPPRRASDLPVLSARNMDAAAQDALVNGYKNSGSGRYSSAARRAAAGAHNHSTGDSPHSEGARASIASNSASQSASPTDPTASRPTSDKPGSSPYAGLDSLDSSLAADGQDAASARDINGNPTAPQSDVASRSGQPSASSDPNAPLGGTLATGSADTTNPAGSAPPPLENPSSMDRQAAGTPPPMNVKLDASAQKPPKALVKRSGQNWALPPELASASGTAMVRIIRIECYDDRLVLLPEGGRGATHVYGFSDGNIDRASLEMATAVRDRVERWGAAMPGGRWHPRLDAKVMPGGEIRYQQLRRLMDGSGVEIQAQEVAP
ncbi:MAG: hypothetical protein ACO1RT_17130 [Planctomycetaceae bacterium]